MSLKKMNSGNFMVTVQNVEGIIIVQSLVNAMSDETSSVVTIEVDGSYIESCGSTVIFKDTRLKMIPIPDSLKTESSTGDEYSVTVDNRTGASYIGLTNWWYDMKEKRQHGEKIVLEQAV